MDRVEKVAVLDNEIEAQLLDGLLLEQHIPHVMRSYHDSAYDGLFQGTGAWGHIEAPLDFHAHVMRVIAEIRPAPSVSFGLRDTLRNLYHMNDSYKKQAAPFIIAGIFFVVLAWRATRIPQGLNYAIGFGGLGLYLWGCFALAKAKNRSPAILLTFFLGGVFPLLVLLILPERHARSSEDDNAPKATRIRCVSCQKPINMEATICPHCGWTQPR